MFVVLDTNHFQELRRDSVSGQRLVARIEANNAEVFCCIVAAEESLRGWLDLIRRRENGMDQLEPYARLQQCIAALNDFTILGFDAEAAVHFQRLRKDLPRAGTMDLKIASICLAHDEVLLSRNLVDFEQNPELKVENWLD